MPLIVDTYNVLHVTGILPPELAGIDVDGLAELVAASRYGAETVWLVCDGRPSSAKAQRRGRIITHYVGKGSDADAHIGRMIDTSSTPRRLTVVSSDQRVRRMALRRRCVALPSDAFLEHLASDAVQVFKPRTVRPAVPLDQRQIDRWVREFGLEQAWMELPTSGRGAAAARPDGHSQAPRDTPHPPAGSSKRSGARHAHSDAAAPQAPAQRRRALEGVERLDQVDPAELDRFDMNEWLPAEARTNRASRRKRGR